MHWLRMGKLALAAALVAPALDVGAKPLGLRDRLVGAAVFGTRADGSEHWSRFSTERYVVFNWYLLSETCPALAIDEAERSPGRLVPAGALRVRLEALQGEEVFMEVTRPRVVDPANIGGCGMTLDAQGRAVLDGKPVVVLHEWRPKDD